MGVFNDEVLAKKVQHDIIVQLDTIQKGLYGSKKEAIKLKADLQSRSAVIGATSEISEELQAEMVECYNIVLAYIDALDAHDDFVTGE